MYHLSIDMIPYLSSSSPTSSLTNTCPPSFSSSTHTHTAAWGELHGTGKNQGEVLCIRSFEMSVLFLPSRFKSLKREFSVTPDHPLLGLKAPPQENIHAFYAASAVTAKYHKPGLLAFPIPYAVPPPPYNFFSKDDEPW